MHTIARCCFSFLSFVAFIGFRFFKIHPKIKIKKSKHFGSFWRWSSQGLIENHSNSMSKDDSVEARMGQPAPPDDFEALPESLQQALNTDNLAEFRANNVAATDVSLIWRAGATLLHHIVSRGANTILKDVLPQVSFPDVRDRVRGFTPLHIAVARGDCDATRLLVSRGSNARLSTPDGQTILHLAAKNGDVPMCASLLSTVGEEVLQQLAEHRDNRAVVPLDVALSSSHAPLLPFLIRLTCANDAAKMRRVGAYCSNVMNENLAWENVRTGAGETTAPPPTPPLPKAPYALSPRVTLCQCAEECARRLSCLPGFETEAFYSALSHIADQLFPPTPQQLLEVVRRHLHPTDSDMAHQVGKVLYFAFTRARAASALGQSLIQQHSTLLQGAICVVREQEVRLGMLLREIAIRVPIPNELCSLVAVPAPSEQFLRLDRSNHLLGAVTTSQWVR